MLDFILFESSYRFYILKIDIFHCLHVYRLQTKLEDLEHLMNDEVTDINEAIKVINNLQVGFM